jgi:hypothetical protein
MWLMFNIAGQNACAFYCRVGSCLVCARDPLVAKIYYAAPTLAALNDAYLARQSQLSQ